MPWVLVDILSPIQITGNDDSGDKYNNKHWAQKNTGHQLVEVLVEWLRGTDGKCHAMQREFYGQNEDGGLRVSSPLAGQHVVADLDVSPRPGSNDLGVLQKAGKKMSNWQWTPVSECMIITVNKLLELEWEHLQVREILSLVTGVILGPSLSLTPHIWSVHQLLLSLSLSLSLRQIQNLTTFHHLHSSLSHYCLTLGLL